MSQCDEIINYMMKYGSITPLDAFREFGCMRLAARISDLKDKGYTILDQTETYLNSQGKKKRYKRYALGSFIM